MTHYGLGAWDYSNEVDATSIPVETGIRTLRIETASLDPTTKEYRISFHDVNNKAEFTLVYWLNSSDENGNIISNTSQRGTLISLGKALYMDSDEPVGIPMPSKIVGGVVNAEVKMSKPNETGKTFPRIYKFMPAKSEDVILHSKINQYSED